jgi:hypothetical protein
MERKSLSIYAQQMQAVFRNAKKKRQVTFEAPKHYVISQDDPHQLEIIPNKNPPKVRRSISSGFYPAFEQMQVS